MTAQVPDWLNYQGEKHRLYSNPLESYFNEEHPRPDFCGPFGSNNWRRYVAAWEIEDETLYLVSVSGFISITPTIVTGSDNVKEVELKDLFPWASDRVKATWFTGELRVPRGEQIEHVDGGYPGMYEEDLLLTFAEGKLVRTEVRDNRHLIPEIRKRQEEQEKQWEKVRPYAEAYFESLEGRRRRWKELPTLEKIVTVIAVPLFILFVLFIFPYLIYKHGWNPKKWGLF
jgi:hypothetical protein